MQGVPNTNNDYSYNFSFYNFSFYNFSFYTCYCSIQGARGEGRC